MEIKYADRKTKLIRENKRSQYGGDNIRYKWQLKAKWIEEFKELLKKELDIPIRYIF